MKNRCAGFAFCVIVVGATRVAMAAELTPLAYRGAVSLDGGVERNVEFRGRLEGDTLSGSVGVGDRTVYVIGRRGSDDVLRGTVHLKDGSGLGTFEATPTGETVSVSYDVGGRRGTVALPSRSLPGLRDAKAESSVPNGHGGD